MGSMERLTDSMCFWSLTNFRSTFKLSTVQNAWAPHGYFARYSGHVLEKKKYKLYLVNKNLNLSKKRKKSHKVFAEWKKIGIDLTHILQRFSFEFYFHMEIFFSWLVNQVLNCCLKLRVGDCGPTTSININEIMHQHTPMRLHSWKSVYKTPQRLKFSFISRRLN